MTLQIKGGENSSIVKIGMGFFGIIVLAMFYNFFSEISTNGLDDPKIYTYLLSGLGPIIIAIIIARLVKTTYHVRTMILGQVYFFIKILQYVLVQYSLNETYSFGIILAILGLILIGFYLYKLIKRSKDLMKWTDILLGIELIYFLGIGIFLVVNKTISDSTSIISAIIVSTILIIMSFRLRSHIKKLTT